MCAVATVSPETEALVTDLAAVNRAGLLTDCSQPGIVRGSSAQRAWVSGWCTGVVQQTWAGAFDDPLQVFEWATGRLAAELGRLWFVDVIDPAWGGKDLLWPTLRAALLNGPSRGGR
jgi:hypothetical protein